MYAFTGDRIYAPDRGAGTSRYAEVIAGEHADGHPPYWVRWSDSDDPELWFPDPAALVEHAGPTYPPEYDATRVAGGTQS